MLSSSFGDGKAQQFKGGTSFERFKETTRDYGMEIEVLEKVIFKITVDTARPRPQSPFIGKCEYETKEMDSLLTVA